jgi:hypothetical protein
MNNQIRRFFGRDEEQGQALILFAILMLALLFAVGLAIDAGQLYSAKRTEQEAADAAAFAGAVVIYQSAAPCNATCQSAAVAAARQDAEINGYVDGVNLTTVVVNFPPLSGAYVNDMRHVEVIITRQVKTSLVPAEAVFNPVRARGVAGAEPLQNNYALMALDRGNTPQGFNASPNADVHLHGGGILVNSTNAAAAMNDQDHASRFSIDTPYTLDVTGGYLGHWFDLGIPVNASHAQVADPFAGFPKPSTSGLPVCTTLVACQDAFGRQNPGVYKVNLGGAGNSALNLNAGIFILEAGMDTSGNGDVNGSGILLYNTYTTYPATPGANPTCSAINLSGNGDAVLSAKTTGTWANLLVYQDPACDETMEIAGNGNFTGTGSIYLPNAQFVFDGNNAELVGSQLIAQKVDVQNGNVTINYNPNVTAQPILPRLAE